MNTNFVNSQILSENGEIEGVNDRVEGCKKVDL